MYTDVQGKINEKRLAFNNTLLPLFEAVVNSIHAIEEDNSPNPGVIEITIVRTNQSNLLDEQAQRQIVGFDITDNGIGFNEPNFESFNFMNSTYKSTKGGKGVGRVTWLRAFGKVAIESYFKEKEHWIYRTFNFEPSKAGIEKHKTKKFETIEKRFTKVSLKNLKEPYWKWCNNHIEDIAVKIIEHCFIYFLDKQCPRIILRDGELEVVVNDLFFQFTNGQVYTRNIQITNEDFEVKMVRLYNARKPDNKIHFVADAREVENEDIPGVDAFMVDNDGRRFSLAVYITGNYLNDRVNDERTQIHFPAKKIEATLMEELGKEDLIEKISEVIREAFSDSLLQLEKERNERIAGFVIEHPQYKQLLKYKPVQVRKISAKLPDDKLELELFKLKQELDLEVRKEADTVFKQIDKISSIEEIDQFKHQHDQFYQKVIEVGNSTLSEYILYRKFVLNFLEKHLKKSGNGKFSREDVIHKLIFPLKSESDDIGYDEHNLWIIDERLAFHQYLAFDKSFKQNLLTESVSADRPDILIFNKPFVLSDSEKPYSSIVLVEFKRPMREDYDEEENPISQVTKYTRELIQNKVKDKSGRLFDLRPSTPVYAFIICDLTPKLRDKAEENGFTKLPDNDGYFSFNQNYSLYIEIISFDKLIRDSKQRNKVLFEKLSISSL